MWGGGHGSPGAHEAPDAAWHSECQLVRINSCFWAKILVQSRPGRRPTGRGTSKVRPASPTAGGPPREEELDHAHREGRPEGGFCASLPRLSYVSPERRQGVPRGLLGPGGVTAGAPRRSAGRSERAVGRDQGGAAPPAALRLCAPRLGARAAVPLAGSSVARRGPPRAGRRPGLRGHPKEGGRRPSGPHRLHPEPPLARRPPGPPRATY